MTEPMRVLVARDHTSGCLLCPPQLEALASRGWELLEPTLTDEAAVAALEAEEAQVCVLDRADAGSALRFLAATRDVGCRIPVVALVAAGQAHLAEELMAAGAEDVLLDFELDESRFERALGNARDRARAGEALRASWRRFRALLEHSTEGVIVLDGAGKVRYANDAVRQLLGYWSHELIGKYLFDFAHPEDARHAEVLFHDAVNSPHQPVAGRLRIQHRGGHWRHLEWVVAGHLEDPDVRGVVVNCRDVTEQHQALEQMRHAVGRLDHWQRAWSALMAVVRALHPGEGDRREQLDTVVRVLSSALSDDGRVGIRIVAGGLSISSAALPEGSHRQHADFRLPDGQVARLEILSPADGAGETSCRVEQQELIDAVCLMLQCDFAHVAQPSNGRRAAGCAVNGRRRTVSKAGKGVIADEISVSIID